MSHYTQKYAQLSFEDSLNTEYQIEQQVVTTGIKLSEQIRVWAELKHIQHDQGYYPLGLHTICAYIKNRLRTNGWPEGKVLYVNDVLPSMYKDHRYDHDLADYQRIGEPIPQPTPAEVYGDFEQQAKYTYNKEQLRNMSIAQLLELIPRKIGLNKEWAKRLKMEQDDMLDICQERNIKIPQLEKVSAESPPSWMWKKTKPWYAVKRLAETYHRIGFRLDRIADLMEQFAPTDDIAEEVNNYFEQYYKYAEAFEKMSIFYARGFEDILVPVDDSKYCASASKWQKIGYDQIVNAGSHGSGVINAIRTGEWVFRESKDPNFDMIMIPLEREFTREQVGDKTAKDLLLKARNMLTAHPIERAILAWSRKPCSEKIINTPEDFYKTLKR